VSAANDWGLWVNECGIFASRIAADRWTDFLLRAKEGRLAMLWSGPGGGEWHVMCGSREEAREVREVFTEAGFRKNHVKVARLSACKAKVAEQVQRVQAERAAWEAERAQSGDPGALDEAWSWWVTEVMPGRDKDRQAAQDAYWAMVCGGGKAEALRLYRAHMSRVEQVAS